MAEPVKTAPPSQAAQAPIFAKTHDLLLWLLPHTAKFPKSERFRLAKRVDDSAFRFYDLIARATKAGHKRRSVLLEADLELDRLRLNVRLCVELKLLNMAQYRIALEKLRHSRRFWGDRHCARSEAVSWQVRRLLRPANSAGLAMTFGCGGRPRYEYAAAALVEIGKLLGGWLKTAV